MVCSQPLPLPLPTRAVTALLRLGGPLVIAPLVRVPQRPTTAAVSMRPRVPANESSSLTTELCRLDELPWTFRLFRIQQWWEGAKCVVSVCVAVWSCWRPARGVDESWGDSRWQLVFERGWCLAERRRGKIEFNHVIRRENEYLASRSLIHFDTEHRLLESLSLFFFFFYKNNPDSSPPDFKDDRGILRTALDSHPPSSGHLCWRWRCYYKSFNFVLLILRASLNDLYCTSFRRYPTIIYYWTVHLILDHSWIVGNLTNSKLNET